MQENDVCRTMKQLQISVFVDFLVARAWRVYLGAGKCVILSAKGCATTYERHTRMRRSKSGTISLSSQSGP